MTFINVFIGCMLRFSNVKTQNQATRNPQGGVPDGKIPQVIQPASSDAGK